MTTRRLMINLKVLTIASAVAVAYCGGAISASAETDAELAAEIAAACGGDPTCIAQQWALVQAQRCADGRCFSSESVTCQYLGMFCPDDDLGDD